MELGHTILQPYSYTLRVFFPPSSITHQHSLQDRAESLLMAGWARLYERANIILLEEFLTVHQDEGNVL